MTDLIREALAAWLSKRRLRSDDWLFPSRNYTGDHVTTRQYSRLVDEWFALAGLNPAAYGTHSLRRAKVALVYKRTDHLRACQLLLGHSKLEASFALNQYHDGRRAGLVRANRSLTLAAATYPPLPTELDGLQTLMLPTNAARLISHIGSAGSGCSA